MARRNSNTLVTDFDYQLRVFTIRVDVLKRQAFSNVKILDNLNKQCNKETTKKLKS